MEIIQNVAICFLPVFSFKANIIREKNTRTMAFPLSLANFVVSSEWTTYGFLINDINIIVSIYKNFVFHV